MNKYSLNHTINYFIDNITKAAVLNIQLNWNYNTGLFKDEQTIVYRITERLKVLINVY